MPAPKQFIDLPLAVGLDTKSDPKVAKGLLSVKNAEVRKTGLIEKRRAFAPLGTLTQNGGHNQTPENANVLSRLRSSETRLAEGYGLAAHKDQLLLAGRDKLSSTAAASMLAGPLLGEYFPLTNRWAPKANVVPLEARVLRAGESNSVTEEVVAVGAGYRLHMYLSGTTPVIQIVREETGEPVLRASQSGGGITTRMSGYFIYNPSIGKESFIGYGVDAGNNDLDRIVWNTATPTTVPARTNAAFSDLHSDRLWDCCPTPKKNALVVAYKESAAGSLKIAKVNAAGTAVETAVTIANTVANCITVFPITLVDGTERYAVVYDVGSDLQCTIVSSDLATTVHDGSLGTFNATQVSGCQVDWNGSDGAFLVAWTDDTAADEDKATRFGVAPHAFVGSGFNNTVVMYHTSLIAKLFTHKGRAYAPCAYDSALQKTYFLYAVTTLDNNELDRPLLVGKFLYTRGAGNRTTTSHLSPTVEVEPGRFVWAARRQDRADATPSATQSSIESPVAIEVTLDAPLPHALLFGKTSILPGGVVAALDGEWQELGWHIYPENVTGADTGAGSMGAGDYSYVVFAEWVDRNGQIHRSSTSVPITVTVGASRQVTLTIRTLQHSHIGRHNAPFVTFHVYRTEAGGTAYYRSTSSDEDWQAASTFTIVDDTTDATLIARDRLYTDSLQLEPMAPPAGDIMCASDKRLYLVPFDDPETVWCSKPKEEAFAPEFVDGLYQRIAADGDNTGLAYMDGQVVVFKRRAIYVFGGEGPNAVGAGEFYPPRKLASLIGCIDKRSIVVTQEGVIFRSEAGYYLLGRGFDVQPIGLPVVAFAQEAVGAAITVPHLEQVWFVLRKSKTVLVFDYIHKLWGTHELEKAAVGAVCIGTDVYFAATDGTVFKRDATKPAEVAFEAGTAWYKLAPQMLQKVWWMHLMGELDASFEVKVSYEYGESAYTQTLKFPAKKGRKMVRIKPAKKKCTAFRLDIVQTGKLSLDMGLNGLSLAVAPLGRLSRLASAETK